MADLGLVPDQTLKHLLETSTAATQLPDHSQPTAMAYFKQETKIFTTDSHEAVFLPNDS